MVTISHPIGTKPRKRREATALKLALVLGVSALWQAACGSGEPAEPAEMTTSSTQAAITASQVATALSPTLQAAAAAIQGLPADLKGMLTDQQLQQMQTALKQRLGGSSGCATISKVAPGTLEITYADCTYGSAPKTITVNGALTLAWSIQLLKASATLSGTFDQLTINNATLDGTISATLSLAKGKGAISTVIDLSHSEGGVTSTIKLQGSMALALATQSATFSGNGTVSGSQSSYTLTVADLVVKNGDGAPSSGSIAAKTGGITVELVFSASTPTEGTFTVIFNGISFGEMSIDDLIALLGKLGGQS